MIYQCFISELIGCPFAIYNQTLISKLLVVNTKHINVNFEYKKMLQKMDFIKMLGIFHELFESQ